MFRLLTFAITVFAGTMTGIDLPAFAQQLPLDRGLTYLRSTQNSDGSWGGTTTALTSVFPSTTTVVDTLRMIESTPSTNRTNAIQYLSAQTLDVTDYLSRRIVSLNGTGVTTSADVTALLLLRNIDGGWGAAAGFPSDPLDAALALRTFAAAGNADATVINGAVEYLLSTQNPDGGWGLTAGQSSEVYYTALVVQAFETQPQTTGIATAISRAISYMAAFQQANGGWGSVFETAEAYLALSPVSTDATVLGGAINNLLTTQSADGSWGQDAYSTALALQALYLSQYKPAPPPPAPTTNTPPDPPTPGATETTLNGQVMDVQTGHPIPGASVSVSGMTLIATAASDGIYQLSGITQLEFSIIASAPGYNSQIQTVTTSDYGTYTLNFQLSPSQIGSLRITTLTTDMAIYQANREVTVTATVENAGLVQVETWIAGQIRGPQGVIIAFLTPFVPQVTVMPQTQTTVGLLWNTVRFEPGTYSAVVQVTDQLGLTLAEAEVPFVIEPSVGIANAVIRATPAFSSVGATTTETVVLSLINTSNTNASLTIIYEVQSPSRAVLNDGTTPLVITPDAATVNANLATFSQTFSVSGNYPVQAQIYNGTTLLATLTGSISVAPIMRIEPSITLTPSTVIPDGDKRIHIDLHLEGVER